MREGALDKVVYEAAATGMPVLASNSGFDDILPPELRFDRADPAQLAAKLRSLQGIDRNALGRELRARVEERHSVTHWARALLEARRRRSAAAALLPARRRSSSVKARSSAAAASSASTKSHGDAVASRPGEDPGRHRLVGDEDQRERAERGRHEEEADEPSR